MRKHDGWITALFTLVFIAAPAIIGYYFLLKDWGHTYWLKTDHSVTIKVAKVELSYGAMWGVAIGYLAYVAALWAGLILLKVLTIDSLSFAVPLALVFGAIFLTSGITLWGRALIVIALVFVAFPVNIGVTKMKEWQIRKNRDRNKQR